MLLRLRLGYVAHGDGDRERGNGHIQEEHEPPRGGVDQPAAEKRTDGTGDCGQARPSADRAAAI